MLRILFSGCLFTFLAFSCCLKACASECVPAVMASRNNLYLPEGGSVSLHCDVLHCHQKWTGGWGVRQEQFIFLTSSLRVHLANVTTTQNTTRLFLTIDNLNLSDSGGYQCNVHWRESNSQGHVIQINVTAAILPEPTERQLSHRLLVCAAASLCFPLALALAYCFSSDFQPAPPIPSPRSQSGSTARVKPKAEVVYAEMSVNQQAAARGRPATTAVIYSTLNFSAT